MKYIEVVEFGKRGALHHHIIMNSCTDAMGKMREKWTFGRIHFHLLDDTGEYSKLASYILKQRKHWKEAGGKGKQYSRSRNLDIPETKKEIVKTSDGYYEKPRVRKGWYIAPDSETCFTTEAGWRYMRYILVKDNRRRGP